MSHAAPSLSGHRQVQICSVFAHLLLLGLSAVLLGLSFPEPGWGLLAHVALVPAGVVAIRSASSALLTWTSYVVSFGWWLWILRWLIPVTGGGYVALCAYLAIYLPLALLCIRWLAQHRLTLLTLAVPAVWTSLELIRGKILAGGFGWFALAHTQAAFRPHQSPGLIVQSADLFGEQTVTFLVAMTNGLLIDLLIRPWFVPRKESRRISNPIKLAMACWLVTTGTAVTYGMKRMVVPGPADAISIAVVQTNTPHDNKIHPTPEKQNADWHRLLELTRIAAHPTDAARAPQLIVWPETVTPAPINPAARTYFTSASRFYRKKDPALAEHYRNLLHYHTDIANLAREIKTAIVVGGSAHDFADPPHRYNAAYLYYRSGIQPTQRYDKIHRVPFGEYTPWVDTWPWLKGLFFKYISPYEFDYTIQPGSTYTVFDVPVSSRDTPPDAPKDDGAITAPPRIVRLGPSICFEDTVARITRRMVYDDSGHKRVDVLVNLTNDGWYPGDSQRQQHLQAAVLRSIENRVPTARAVNTGISGFIDSTGRIGPLVVNNNQTQHVDGLARHNVTIDPRETLFGRVGQIPMAALAIATGIWLYLAAVRPILKGHATG